MVAKLSDLRDLFRFEFDDLVKQSLLTEVAVYPKPIKRQKVSTCLKAFSDKTITALKTHTRINQHDACGTIKFIESISSRGQCQGREFNNFLILNNLVELINEPTHIRDDGSQS